MALTPEQAEARTILKILAGSHVHGLNTEASDRDEEAIVIEPLTQAWGIGEPWEDTVRESPEIDVKYFSLRKWVRMAAKGNPNFLLMLFAPESHVLKIDPLGRQLREMRQLFLSRQSIKSHLGYMQGQRNRLVNHQREFGAGGGRGKPRTELIEKFGYDTKFGMHLIRLGHQGLELARDGRITLPIEDDTRIRLLKVRAGNVDLDFVLNWADLLEKEMKAAFDSSPLPEHPDYAAIESWMQKAYLRAWHADSILAEHVANEAWGADIVLRGDGQVH